MASNNIQLKFNLDTKEVQFATDKVMNMTQQIRALKRELGTTGKYTDEQFQIMSKSLGDLEDGFARTKARSGDLVTTLQLVPGPIGEIASKFNGAISLMKTFSGFKLDDLKFQFKETLDDIKDIGSTIGKVTGLSKAWTTATNTLTSAFKFLGLAQNTAAVASKALAGAIAATGVGLLIVGISTLITKISEWTSGTEKAEQAQNNLANSIKRVSKSLEDQQGAIADQTELDAMRAKVAGKTEGDIQKIRADGLKKQIQLDKDALGEKGSFNQQLMKIELNRDIDDKQRQKLREDITAERNAAGKRVYTNTIALEKLGLQAQIDANANAKTQGEKGLADKKTLAEKEKQFQQQKLADQKSALDAQIEQEVSSATTSAEKLEALYKKRNKFDLDELDAAEKNAKALYEQGKISGDERNNLLAGIAAKRANIATKTTETIKKAVKDDSDAVEEQKKIDNESIQNTEDFNRKVRDLRTNAILDDTAREKQARQDKYDDDLAAIEKDKEFIKKSETEKAEIRKLLKQNLENDVAKIDKAVKDKELEKDKEHALVKLRILELQGQSLLKGTKAYFDNRRAITDETEKTELAQLKADLDSKKLTQEEYQKAVTATEEKYVKLRKELKKEELAAIGQTISATIDSFANLGNAIAGSYEEEAKTSKDAFEKRKKLQIATAIMSAASGLVQILTQPSTLPSPFDWIVKGINAVALGIATKTNIDKIKATKFEGGGDSAGAAPAPYSVTANRASGGIVTGPGSSTSDSINARLSNGEYVVNARATSAFLPLLNSINDQGLRPRFAAGGLVSSQASSMSGGDITRAVQSGIMEMPLRTYVVGKDMTNQQQFDRTIKSRSII